MNPRQAQIMELVVDQGRVEVAELAERFDVSQVTVRKDLDLLESAGVLSREHGWAVAAPADSMERRMAFHYETKLAIARAAAATVAPGSTVMVESGSCCALFCRELHTVQPSTTIVTNSVYIAELVRPLGGAVVLLGGTYQPRSQALVGPLTAQTAQNFYVDHLFVGADGYTPADGFTGADIARADAVRAMSRQARQVTVLSESAKFPHRGEVHLLDAEQVGRVVTDDRLAADMAEDFSRHGVRVVQVPVA